MPNDSARTVVVRDVRSWTQQQATDLVVEDGRITAIGDATAEAAGGAEVVDGGGRIALPGLVDAHAHLDKTTWGTPYRPNTAGPGLAGRIANERAVRGTLPASVQQRAGALLDRYTECGTTLARTHVDVDPDAGTTSVESVLAAAEARRDRIDVQVVAFPQSGLLVEPGTAELLERAVEVGTEAGFETLVGGLDPAGYDQDPVGHLDVVFGIADRQGCGVDIHLHDRGSLGAWQVELIAERTRVSGMAGRVNVSHCFCLSTVDEARQAELIALLAEHDISVTTVAPLSSPQLPLKALRSAGVRVGLGNDGVRDLWSPYGDGDMIERAMLLAQASGFVTDDELAAALEVASRGGAGICDAGIRGSGIRGSAGISVGDRGDLVLVPGVTVGEIVVGRPAERTVLKAGRAARTGVTD